MPVWLKGLLEHLVEHLVRRAIVYTVAAVIVLLGTIALLA